MKYVILVVIMEDVDLGLKRPVTLTFIIVEILLMMISDLDKCIRPSTTPPIIQLRLVYHWVSMFMVVRELEIDIRPSTFLYITMVDYKLSTQGYLKKILEEVCKEKIF